VKIIRNIALIALIIIGLVAAFYLFTLITAWI